MAAPLTRGWTPPGLGRSAAWRGCPAHAGMDPYNWPIRSLLPWLPRSRGDGPGSATAVLVTVKAAPLTRGWTVVGRWQIERASGCPAHAGMDPRCRQHQGPDDRLPRSRGDGPCASCGIRASGQAAPLTRGWTPRAPPPPAGARGCPAHAGMDPDPGRPRCLCARLPRSRGDGPCSSTAGSVLRLAAPLTRGWTQELCRPRPIRPGCPAHAGMDPPWRCSARPARRLPRSRGDGPVS